MNKKELLEMEEVRGLINLAYLYGYSNGVEAYAWMKAGTYFVGTTGQTLNEALSSLTKHHNFNARLAEDMLKQAQEAEDFVRKQKKDRQ